MGTDAVKGKLAIRGIALAVGGYALKRWVTSAMTKDAAEAGALKIKDEIIRQLRLELRERDADWQARMDRKEKELWEFRRKIQSEFETSRRITRSMSNELRAINNGQYPAERGDTQMLITGLGPLDLESGGSG